MDLSSNSTSSFSVSSSSASSSSTDKKISALCQQCLEDNLGEAVQFCETCGYLCEFHVDAHKRSKDTAKHSLRLLGDSKDLKSEKDLKSARSESGLLPSFENKSSELKPEGRESRSQLSKRLLGEELSIIANNWIIIRVWTFKGENDGEFPPSPSQAVIGGLFNGAWGHVSLQTPKNYVSLWPAQKPSNWKSAVRATMNRINEDIQAEERNPDYCTVLHNIDLGAIEQRILQRQQEIKEGELFYSLISNGGKSHNCSGLVMELLKYGKPELEYDSKKCYPPNQVAHVVTRLKEEELTYYQTKYKHIPDLKDKLAIMDSISSSQFDTSETPSGVGLFILRTKHEIVQLPFSDLISTLDYFYVITNKEIFFMNKIVTPLLYEKLECKDLKLLLEHKNLRDFKEVTDLKELSVKQLKTINVFTKHQVKIQRRIGEQKKAVVQYDASAGHLTPFWIRFQSHHPNDIEKEDLKTFPEIIIIKTSKNQYELGFIRKMEKIYNQGPIEDEEIIKMLDKITGHGILSENLQLRRLLLNLVEIYEGVIYELHSKAKKEDKRPNKPWCLVM